jgi:uncharacterized protein
MTCRDFPLFPLSQLLLPGQRMGLQIFEPRYLTMITAQLKRDQGFGVVQIREGREALDKSGQAPLIYPVGTEAAIVDWSQKPGGLLVIQIEGRRRFRVQQSEVQSDQLLLASVGWLADERVDEEASATSDFTSEYDGLLQLLEQLREHPAVVQLNLPAVENASQLGWQLSQLLPLSMPDKMALWQEENSYVRLEQLAERVARLAEE